MSSDSSNSPKLTDSPWFWLMVFSAVAMLGATIIGPKYAVRMARKERMMNANETIAVARQAGVTAGDVDHEMIPVIPYSESDYLKSPQLGWVVGVLGTLMMVGAGGLHFSRVRYRQTAGMA